MPVKQSKSFLVEHWLNVARDKNTESKQFVLALENIGISLFSEIIEELRGIKITKDIKTPITKTKAHYIDQKKIYLIPILRAGLSMLGGIKNIIPESKVAHVGLYRNEFTLQPVWYLDKLPKKFSSDSYFVVLEPMLATGGTLTTVIERMKKLGMKKIYVLSVLTTKKTKLLLEKKFPDVKIHVAGIDPTLNSIGYIVPGLGDAGDRAFNL